MGSIFIKVLTLYTLCYLGNRNNRKVYHAENQYAPGMVLTFEKVVNSLPLIFLQYPLCLMFSAETD